MTQDRSPTSESAAATYTACTVTSPAFLPHARVMTASVAEHDPGARIVVLVLGDGELRDGAGFGPGVEVLGIGDVLSAEEAPRMGLMYSTQGLAGALKPRLLRHLVERDDGPVILIDSDICLYGSLAGVADRAAAGPPVLTTHSTTPLPESDLPMLKAGVFNSGFLAAGPRALPMLEWWCDRTRRDSIYMPWEGILWEQSWLGLAPAFFEVDVPRDPGLNVLGGELLDHDVEWDGDRPRLRDTPLRCFHFSGPYDPHEPELLVSPAPEGHPAIRHTSLGGMSVPWLSLEDKPGALRLSRAYAQRLIDAGWDEPRPEAIFAELDGRPIHRAVRRTYRAGVLAAESGDGTDPPNPFTGAPLDEFYEWLAQPPTPAAAQHGLNRFQLGFRESYFGAASVFPQVPGEDSSAYLDWLEKRLIRDRHVPRPLLPAGRAAAR